MIPKSIFFANDTLSLYYAACDIIQKLNAFDV
jgi:hypothetical protein